MQIKIMYTKKCDYKMTLMPVLNYYHKRQARNKNDGKLFLAAT